MIPYVFRRRTVSRKRARASIQFAARTEPTIQVLYRFITTNLDYKVNCLIKLTICRACAMSKNESVKPTLIIAMDLSICIMHWFLRSILFGNRHSHIRVT